MVTKICQYGTPKPGPDHSPEKRIKISPETGVDNWRAYQVPPENMGRDSYIYPHQVPSLHGKYKKQILKELPGLRNVDNVH